jgi:hypothetical protein
MNLFTPSLTGTEGSWIAEKKKMSACKRIDAIIKQFNDWSVLWLHPVKTFYCGQMMLIIYNILA